MQPKTNMWGTKMRKGYLVLAIVVAALAVAASVALPLIEKGQAMQAVTDSSNDLDVSLSVDANPVSDRLLTIPTTAYTKSADGESYVPNDASLYTTGTLKIHSDDTSTLKLSIIVDFLKKGSWILIDTMDITLTRAQENPITGTIYDSVLATGVAGNPCELTVTKGDYNFTLNIKFKSPIRVEIGDFAGSNMDSRIQFILEKVESTTTPEGSGGTESGTNEDQQSSPGGS